MKISSFLFLLLSATSGLFANTKTDGTTVVLTCNFENCSVVDSLSILQFDGIFYNKIYTIKQDPITHEFKFTAPRTEQPQFYYLGMNTETQKLRMVLLGTEDNVVLQGPCFDLTKATIKNSKVNENYGAAMTRINGLKQETGKIIQEYQQVYADPTKRKEIEDKMGLNDKAKITVLDSLRKSNPLSARIIAMDMYTSYQNNKNKAFYPNEVEYFANEYFQYMDFKDKDYENVPPIFDLFRSYAQVIVMPQLQMSNDQIKTYFDKQLDKFPAKSTAYKYALGGVLSVLIEQKNINLLTFGKKYLEVNANNPESNDKLNQIINDAKNYIVGLPASEISMNDTSGLKKLNLSSLKGKYVMIDFWASWCRPCRAENPNVVALYKKYKDRGFEIFSVSLDQNKDPWIKAIADDNLIWSNHVSDLRGWGNEAARSYGVSSIPFTVLLDKEGNIIAKQLRGEGLVKKLEELLGK
jgi:thiol-disulfide isomerase/thioredoxin